MSMVVVGKRRHREAQMQVFFMIFPSVLHFVGVYTYTYIYLHKYLLLLLTSKTFFISHSSLDLFFSSRLRSNSTHVSNLPPSLFFLDYHSSFFLSTSTLCDPPISKLLPLYPKPSRPFPSLTNMIIISTPSLRLFITQSQELGKKN